MGYKARNGKWYSHKESQYEYFNRRKRRYDTTPHIGNIIMGGAILAVLFMICF